MDEFLTVAEIAERFKVNPQTVRNWIDRGQLPAVRVGARRVRVRQADLDAFLEASSTAPTSREPVDPTVDEGSITAWATFGAALAEATATLEHADRDQLVRALNSLSKATRALAEALT